MGDVELSILILLFLIGYAVLIVVSAWFGVRWAKKRGRSALLWGFLAGFLVYNLMFWDFIPTLVAKRYYCEKEAGLTVYKTLKQWRLENPDVVIGPIPEPEGLVFDKDGYGRKTLPDGTSLQFRPYIDDGNKRIFSFKKADGSYGHWYNSAFYIESIHKKPFSWLPVLMSYGVIVDATNEFVMYRYARVLTDGGKGILAYRFWLGLGGCESKGTREWVRVKTEFYGMENGK